jgi:hypothetical protein
VTIGGLKINANAQVIGTDWRPILDLFTYGETVGSLHYCNSPEGTGLEHRASHRLESPNRSVPSPSTGEGSGRGEAGRYLHSRSLVPPSQSAPARGEGYDVGGRQDYLTDVLVMDAAFGSSAPKSMSEHMVLHALPTHGVVAEVRGAIR